MLTYAQAVAQFDADNTRADVSTVYPAALELPYLFQVEWTTANGEEESIFTSSVADADDLIADCGPGRRDATLTIYTLRDLLTGVL